jgi:starch synthase
MSSRVLFATSEIDDFVQVGGLGAVSAALPRALRPLTDIRVFLPGYREVLERLNDIEIVGFCPAMAQLPACSVAKTSTKDGLTVYVLMCASLYERDSNPYCGPDGKDWPTTTSGLRGLLRPGRYSPPARSIQTGGPTSFTPTTGSRP